ncbi:hypothetical protein [Jeotgalibacillus proteolyticus]|uniref:hypothetical protein n=1 Tax=Jeotgalibacillus proteolyticus TaxID=2082395 RepID=UPI003CF22A8D
MRKTVLYIAGVLSISIFFALQQFIKHEPVDWVENFFGGFIMISVTLTLSWLWNGSRKNETKSKEKSS